MNKNTLTILAVIGAAGVAFYFYKKAAASPIPAPTGAGGGTGANASTSAAYNGTLNPGSLAGGVSWLSGIGASIGHLFDTSGNSTGGASLNVTATADPGYGDGSADIGDYTDDDFDYSTLQ